MPKLYTKEQFWKLYEKLPQELQTALSSEETGENIYNICKENEVEKSLGEIVDYVGAVLVGLLLPEDFEEILKKELVLEKDKAKKIAEEINQLIFYPVRPELEQIHKSEAELEETDEKPIPEEEIETNSEEEYKATPETSKREKKELYSSFSTNRENEDLEEEKIRKSSKEDSYRELVE